MLFFMLGSSTETHKRKNSGFADGCDWYTLLLTSGNHPNDLSARTMGPYSFRKPIPVKGVGLDDPQRSLPTLTIL